MAEALARGPAWRDISSNGVGGPYEVISLAVEKAPADRPDSG